MHRDEMLSLFHQHRKAEAARDFDAIMATFVEDCYLETVALNLRIEGRAQARAAYEGYFTAFPDLTPDDEGFAFGEDVLVTWGTLRGTSKDAFLGIPPSGRAFEVPFVNVARFRAGHMAGESIYFDLASLCDQSGLPLDKLRAAASAPRSAPGTTSRQLLAPADTPWSSRTSLESATSAAASSPVGEDRRRETATTRPRGHTSSKAL
jgi:steroid delta-isomerase-like uncharacterized protein